MPFLKVDSYNDLGAEMEAVIARDAKKRFEHYIDEGVAEDAEGDRARECTNVGKIGMVGGDEPIPAPVTHHVLVVGKTRFFGTISSGAWKVSNCSRASNRSPHFGRAASRKAPSSTSMEAEIPAI